MSNELKHADVICHMAKNDFSSVEGRPHVNYEYVDAKADFNPITHPNWEWRIKPATITYTVTMPPPMREKPKRGEAYWTLGYDGATGDTWTDHEADHKRFNNGTIWATEADAQAAFDELFGPLRS